MRGDLSREALTEHLPGRPLRAYPALLSTEAEALAWARAGAPAGSVVVAGYQASPRGQGGIPWTIPEEGGLGFSLILRPDLPPQQEGWLYVAASVGLAEALGDDTVLDWPDQVLRAGRPIGAVGVRCEPGLLQIPWAVVSVMALGASAPRGPLLAGVVGAIERRLGSDPEETVVAYRSRLLTLGDRIRAHLVPRGPAGPKVEGRAVGVEASGALVVETASGSRLPVRPQDLGELERLA